MVYSLDSDETPYTAPVKNRFTGDWVALHMMSTICRLTDQRNASYNFLKNGGMAFAKNLQELRASDLALAARVVEPTWGDSLQQVLKNDAVPRKVKACFEAMRAASANVVGTDGHRRHCRHEGWAYMEMMRRLAQDPVAQTLQFEFLMRLFLQHVLNVRPETLDCRRGGVRAFAREWCSDGAAAASTGAGMLGPVAAFRGEIEAQGRGSLHPHVLVRLFGCYGTARRSFEAQQSGTPTTFEAFYANGSCQFRVFVASLRASGATPLRRQLHVEERWHQSSGPQPVEVRRRQ